MPFPNRDVAAINDHRRVLGVHADATTDQIKAAYKVHSLRCHPDQPGGSDAAFQRVNDAYKVLAQHAHNERWGTSNSSYGAGTQQSQTLMIAD